MLLWHIPGIAVDSVGLRVSPHASRQLFCALAAEKSISVGRYGTTDMPKATKVSMTNTIVAHRIPIFWIKLCPTVLLDVPAALVSVAYAVAFSI
jgi:hypothetical protein